MKRQPKRRNKPGQGRKPEGRIIGTIGMLPEAWAQLDAQRGTVPRGKHLERVLLSAK